MFVTRGGEAQPLYPKYDAVRMALVNDDESSAAKRAKELSDLAEASEQELIASKAAAVASAGTLEATRHAFAELSDAMITYRNTSEEEPKPIVVYCPMAKHSWLQPKGAISNPYLGPTSDSHRAAGEVGTKQFAARGSLASRRPSTGGQLRPQACATGSRRSATSAKDRGRSFAPGFRIPSLAIPRAQCFVPTRGSSIEPPAR
ncbi:MAG: DUF3347 domain-containing protein [Thermoanaerobaculia bacterium]